MAVLNLDDDVLQHVIAMGDVNWYPGVGLVTPLKATSSRLRNISSIFQTHRVHGEERVVQRKRVQLELWALVVHGKPTSLGVRLRGSSFVDIVWTIASGSTIRQWISNSNSSVARRVPVAGKMEIGRALASGLRRIKVAAQTDSDGDGSCLYKRFVFATDTSRAFNVLLWCPDGPCVRGAL